MIDIVKTKNGHVISVDGKNYAVIPALEGATDTFEPIEDGAWKWHRHTDVPTDHMRMEMIFLGEPTFTMIPAVSYNGKWLGHCARICGRPCRGRHALELFLPPLHHSRLHLQ